MLNPIKEKESKGIVILDKKKSFVYSNVNDDIYKLIRKCNIDSLIINEGKDVFIKDYVITVEKIVRNGDVEYILIITRENISFYNKLSQYKNLNTGLYGKTLLRDIKNGTFDTNFFNKYSIIFIEIRGNKVDIETLAKFERAVVSNVRKVDITIRYDNNTLLIITPIAQMDYLNNFIKRIRDTVVNKFALMSIYFDLFIGAATSSDDINFLDVLYNAQKNICKEKKNNKFLKFEKETNISARIEKVRQELYSMLNNFDEIASNNEVVEMSQYLDRLLVDHIKGYGGDDYCKR